MNEIVIHPPLIILSEQPPGPGEGTPRVLLPQVENRCHRAWVLKLWVASSRGWWADQWWVVEDKSCFKLSSLFCPTNAYQLLDSDISNDQSSENKKLNEVNGLLLLYNIWTKRIKFQSNSNLLISKSNPNII